ncbi:unnamed protein product [Moneuplotes crassus]|uniref:Cytochrome b5 heme-binding domain-containing protein n=1 Tax=Euplotes crassus TaxID=5936 RepID=A0AAD1Y7A5_EUPCR|nr:unnamed protein product [Moneuplotes crassus]
MIDKTKKNFIFKVNLLYGYYLGIGFGKNMTNVPILVINDEEADKKTIPVLMDTYSKKYGYPQANQENIYQMVRAEAMETGWDLTIQRPIALEREGRDESIPLDELINMIYAFKESYGKHTRQDRGFFTMGINSRTRIAEFDSTIDANDIYYKVHGILFYISWSIMSFALIVSGRYMKHLYNFRMLIHASVGFLLAANTLILVLLSLMKFTVKGDDYVAHKPIGITVMVASVVQCFGGISLKKSLTSLNWNSKFTKNAKIGHQVFGLSLVFLSNFQVTTGLYKYQSPVRDLIYIHFGVFILMILVIEISFRLRFKYMKKGFIVHKEIRTYSIEEFRSLIKSGKKLALFNDYILDLKSFVSEHPGGSFVLKESIGKDVGKYFYGVSSMENGVAPYEHSRYAGRIIEKLVIGQLENKYKGEDTLRTSLNESKSLHSDNQSRLVTEVEENSHTYTIKKKTWITSNVSRISFHSIDASVSRIYPGLEMCGKSYSITSLKNHVTRYYTICNCMGSLIYDEYIRSLDAAIESRSYQRKFSTISDFNTKETDTLELVLKNYPMSTKGISPQVFNATYQEQFYLQGPMGAGFDYTEENLQGTNVVFCGGTGILPFMDLFAYLGRRLVASHCSDYSMFADETISSKESQARFIIYAYFQTRQDCIGIEMVEKIEKLYQKYNKGEFFKLNLILTSEGGQKLDNDDIIELLQDYSMVGGGLNKLLVCGPPTMNNLFQKLTGKIIEKVGLDQCAVDIL